MSRDGNRIAINNANNITALDGTATPKKSPLTVSSTPIPITPPLGALRVVLKPLTADCRVTDDATAADHWFTIKAGDTLSVDCANETPFYVMRDATTDATLYFLFYYI